MSKFNLYYRKRSPISFAEAVGYTTDPDYDGGVIEKLRETINNQNAMLARMLMVQFGDYEDHFSSPEHEPKTDAEKLAFIFDDITVTEGI